MNPTIVRWAFIAVLLWVAMFLPSCRGESHEEKSYLDIADEEVSRYGTPEISTDQVARLMKSDAVPLILDIREPEEYAVSHLPGAIVVPPDQLDPDAFSDVPSTRTIVTYCTMGVRSAIAANQLIKSGRGNVYNMRGSLIQWYNEGRPVVRDEIPVDEIHPYDRYWGGFIRKGEGTIKLPPQE